MTEATSTTQVVTTSETDLLPGGFHRFNPQADFSDNQETNRSRPLTDAVITVRIIKSFEYRSMKAFVPKSIDLTKTTITELIELCRNQVRTSPSFKAFRSFADQLDTLKLYTKAHGSKTTNLIINLDHPEWILVDENIPSLLKLNPDNATTSTTTATTNENVAKTCSNTTLAEIGIENETELSLFNRKLYEEFLSHPETKWDTTG